MSWQSRSFWPQGCNLAPAIKELLLLGAKGSGHTQETSYQPQLIWFSAGGKKLGLRWDLVVLSCQESKLRTLSTSPRKAGSREQGFPWLPRELSRAPIPHLHKGKPPSNLQEWAGSGSTSWGFPGEATVLRAPIPVAWWVQTPEKGCDHTESHSEEAEGLGTKSEWVWYPSSLAFPTIPRSSECAKFLEHSAKRRIVTLSFLVLQHLPS